MNLPSNCNSSHRCDKAYPHHQGICPSGWHIPYDLDWETLFDFAGGGEVAIAKLKATSGWSWCGPSGSDEPYLCEDTYGFSALPGGYGHPDGSLYFRAVDMIGYWWSAWEVGGTIPDLAYKWNSERASVTSEAKSNLLSVRCVKD